MYFKPRSWLIGLPLLFISGILALYAYVAFFPPSDSEENGDLSQAAFRVGTIFKVSRLHPYDKSSGEFMNVPIFNSLNHIIIKNDEIIQFDFSDDLLESLEVSDDGREAVAHIRKNVYFHNGAILRANDVLYTLRKYLPDKIAGSMLINPNDFKFEIKDEYTVKLVSAKPFNWKPFFSALPILNAQYERSWEGRDPADYIPMGTGPYRYASYDKVTGYLRLERFRKYWRGEPAIGYFDSITYENNDAAMLAIIENRIDYLQNLSPEDQDYVANRVTSLVKLVEFPGSASYSLIFNTNNPKFSDWRVRRGISHLVNRKEIVSDRFALNLIGVMADAPFYMTQPATKPGVEPYEPDKGIKLIESAGYKKDHGWYYKDGKRLEVEVLIVKYNAGYMHVLRLLQRQLGLAGVLMQVKKVSEWSELAELVKNRNFEIVFNDINENTLIGGAYARFKKNHPVNYSGYSDDVLEELFIKAQNSPPDLRLKMAVQARIREKAPIITLFYKKVVIAVSSKYLGDWFYKDPYMLTYINEAGQKGAPTR